VPQGPGPALFNSELYLLALNIAIATGAQLHEDQGFVAGLQTDLIAAKAEFELRFWDAARNITGLLPLDPTLMR